MASEVESTAQNLSKLDIGGDSASSAPNLQKNLSLLSPDQVHICIYMWKLVCVLLKSYVLFNWFIVIGQIELAKMLLEMGQSHLFEHWPEPGVDDDEKKTFLNQV